MFPLKHLYGVTACALISACAPAQPGAPFVLAEGFEVRDIRQVTPQTIAVDFSFSYDGPGRLCFLVVAGTDIRQSAYIVVRDAAGSAVPRTLQPPFAFSVAPEAGEPSFVKVSLEPGTRWDATAEISLAGYETTDLFFDLAIVSQINGVGLQVSCDGEPLAPRVDEFQPRFRIGNS